MRGHGAPQSFLVSAAVAALIGCDGGGSGGSTCAAVTSQSYSVHYFGRVRGAGKLALTKQESGGISAKVQLATPQGAGAPALVLTGSGTCAGGDIRVRLGSGQTRDGKLKVLGGNVVGMMAPGMDLKAFGRYEVDILEVASRKEHRIRGFWEEAPPGDAGTRKARVIDAAAKSNRADSGQRREVPDGTVETAGADARDAGE